MWKLTTLLTCALFLGCIGTSPAAKLDYADTVYIDGIPCNRPCQAYMAWSRSLLPMEATPATTQSEPSQVVQGPKPKAQRRNRIRHAGQRRALPIRVAKKAAPKGIEVSPANPSTPPVDRGEAKTAPPEPAADAPLIPNPTSDSEIGITAGQGLTPPAVENQTTANQAPEQKADSDTKPSGSSEAVPPADAETTALAPNNAEQLIAILVVRVEIESVSDLANKTVAIDASRSESVASVRTAMVAAGASEVQMSEGETLAIERVMNGEVPAAVVSVVDSEAAAAWSAGKPGFKIFRIPLSSPDRG